MRTRDAAALLARPSRGATNPGAGRRRRASAPGAWPRRRSSAMSRRIAACSARRGETAKMRRREALDACRRCELGRRATQAVAGDGPARRAHRAGRRAARRRGRPRGHALRRAGGPRAERRRSRRPASTRRGCTSTNAVKHFRFEPRGKRRIHKTPAQRHVDACRQWLEAELAALDPAVIVTLGATALFAVTGRRSPIAEARAPRPLRAPGGARLVASYHPCSDPARRPTKPREADASDCAGRGTRASPRKRREGRRALGRRRPSRRAADAIDRPAIPVRLV